MSNLLSSGDKNLSMLKATRSSTVALLDQFQSSVAEVRVPLSLDSLSLDDPARQQQQQQPPTDPLTALEKSATLIKARVTKLSLLCINEPFTPSAIKTVLRELSTSAIPVLMSIVQSMPATLWGVTFTGELDRRVQRLLQELKTLLEDIPIPGEAGVSAGPGKKGDPQAKLQSAGVIWNACDELIELKQRGIAGVAAAKAQEYQDMLADAILELREWSREVDHGDKSSQDDGPVHSDDDNDGSNDDDDDDDLDLLLRPRWPLAKDEVHLRAQLESSLKRLSLIKMLYEPIIKRRLRTFPSPAPSASSGTPLKNHAGCLIMLDTLMDHLKVIQDQTDELANTFYEHDAMAADALLQECTSLARKSASKIRLTWTGEEDELTLWLGKWKDMIDI